MKSIPPSIVFLRDNFGEKIIEREDLIEIFTRDRIGGDQDLHILYEICEKIINILKKSNSGLILSNGEEYLPPIRIREVFSIIRILNNYSDKNRELSSSNDSGKIVNFLVGVNINLIKSEIFDFLRNQEFDIDEESYQYICEYPNELIVYFNQI